MIPKDYIKNVLITESVDFEKIAKRFQDKGFLRILHGACGCITESGELMDQIKKSIFYDLPLDRTNVLEEISDNLWYIAVILDELGISFEQAMENNIKKLRKRYGDKWNKNGALNRDLKAEREILEEVKIKDNKCENCNCVDKQRLY